MSLVPVLKVSHVFDSYADIFSERAGSYHRAMATFPSARAAEFEAMVSPLDTRSPISICDLPSGGGYLAAWIPSSWEYTAVEPTESFASLFGQPEGLELLRCPLTAVPRPDDSFGAIVSLAGLHHESDKSAILREIARLLRPDGIAVIADVQQGSNEDRFLNGFVDANSELGHRGEFLDAEFARTIGDAGLVIQSDDLISTPWRFETRAEAAVFAKDLFGISASLEDVANALESIIGLADGDGGIGLAWHLRRLVCRPARGLAT